MNSSREVHALAAFVHGMLVSLHILGAVYNARKENHRQTLMHFAGIAFSVHSVHHHIKRVREHHELS